MFPHDLPVHTTTTPFRKITVNTNESVVEARWATYKGGVEITLLTEARWETLKDIMSRGQALAEAVGAKPISLGVALLIALPRQEALDLNQLCGELYSASAPEGNPVSGEDIRLAADLLRESLR